MTQIIDRQMRELAKTVKWQRAKSPVLQAYKVLQIMTGQNDPLAKHTLGAAAIKRKSGLSKKIDNLVKENAAKTAVIEQLNTRLSLLEQQQKAEVRKHRLAGMKQFPPGVTLAQSMGELIGSIKEDDPHWVETVTQEYRRRKIEENA